MKPIKHIHSDELPHNEVVEHKARRETALQTLAHIEHGAVGVAASNPVMEGGVHRAGVGSSSDFGEIPLKNAKKWFTSDAEFVKNM